MLRFHHVNLAIGNGRVDDEATFLVEVLGMTRIEPGPELEAMGARWFGFAAGGEVHLSRDDGHTPSSRGHVAVDVGDDLAEITQRLDRAGTEWRESNGIVFCNDPGGNLWEIRGRLER